MKDIIIGFFFIMFCILFYVFGWEARGRQIQKIQGTVTINNCEKYNNMIEKFEGEYKIKK